MADMYPKPLSKLIAAFEMFPGIGRKMASRLVFIFLLWMMIGLSSYQMR